MKSRVGNKYVLNLIYTNLLLCIFHESLWRELQFARELFHDHEKVCEIKKFPFKNVPLFMLQTPITLLPCFRFKCRDIAIKWFPHSSSSTTTRVKLHFHPSQQCLWIYLSEWWKKLFAHESLIGKLLENWIFIIIMIWATTTLFHIHCTSIHTHSDQPIKGSLIITPSCVLIEFSTNNIDWEVDAAAAVDISDYHINSMRCWWWSHFRIFT